jgi:hypothetical protein
MNRIFFISICNINGLIFYQFLVCNHSQENLKTKTWRPCWHHKQKKLMRDLLLTSSNMAAMTSRANEELYMAFLAGYKLPSSKSVIYKIFFKNNYVFKKPTVSNCCAALFSYLFCMFIT